MRTEWHVEWCICERVSFGLLTLEIVGSIIVMIRKAGFSCITCLRFSSNAFLAHSITASYFRVILLKLRAIDATGRLHREELMGKRNFGYH